MTRNSPSHFVHLNSDAVVRCYDSVCSVWFCLVWFDSGQSHVSRVFVVHWLNNERISEKRQHFFVSSPLRLPSSSFSFSSSYPFIEDVLVLHSLDHHGHVTSVPFVWAARGKREREENNDAWSNAWSNASFCLLLFHFCFQTWSASREWYCMQYCCFRTWCFWTSVAGIFFTWHVLPLFKYLHR